MGFFLKMEAGQPNETFPNKFSKKKSEACRQFQDWSMKVTVSETDSDANLHLMG